MYCDMHMHSIFSDGTDTPTQLIEKAEHLGLSAVALCDHNTVSGLPEFLKAAEGKCVTAVPGVEFSTAYKERELHILALFIKEKFYEDIMNLVSEADQRKEESNIDLIHNLNQAGYKLDYEKIKSERPDGRVNRAHIAAALTEAGYVSSIEEAFQNILAKKHGYYHPPKRLDALEIIRYIKSIGAVAVWAHPFFNLKEKQVREFLNDAKPCGLDGMETIYSTYSDEETKLAISIAKEYVLLQSGGSDYHGNNKPNIQIGIGRGSLRIPNIFFKEMEKLVNLKIDL